MTTDGMSPKDWKIGEEELYAAAPLVRGLVVQRYEDLYGLCEQHFQGAEAGGRPVDPRWAEIAVRVLKEQATIYRLSQAPKVEEEDQLGLLGVDHAAEIAVRLAQMEAEQAKLKEL